MRTNWKYICVCIACGLMAASTLMAVPARRGWRTVQTLDGTEVKVQQVGDEFYHFWMTDDGRMVERTAAGFRVTDEDIPSEEQIAARRASSPLMEGRPRKVGKVNLAPRGLVILAAFSDVSFQSENDSLGFYRMMNEEGYDYNEATGSAVDYFMSQSNGQYVPAFDVVGPIVLPNECAYYGTNRTDEKGSDKNPAEMIVDACRAVNKEVDFTLYDNDNDGWIDFVYVIYAGMGEADGGAPETIWPHNWRIKSAGLECRLDGKYLNNYACSAELDGVGKRCGIGTPCHEFGHVIGLPDYYDTSTSGYNSINILTPNDWSIMDYGCYNNDARTPCNYSIFDKYFFGWATPQVLPKDDKASIRMTSGYNDAYQINGDTSLLPYNAQQVVYYLENRQKSGWDEYLPGHGMIVWRVDYRQSVWNDNKVNATQDVVRYTVVAADGSQKIGDYWKKIKGEWVMLHEGKTDPFPGAAEIHTYTPFEGCELTDIQETDSEISFLFNGGVEPTGTEEIQTPAEGYKKVIYNGQLYIMRADAVFSMMGVRIK